MKLHLGSGHTRIDGFTNVDIRELPETDIKGSVDKLDFVKDGEAEEIACFHCLEHFSYYHVLDVLKEWNRALKIDGILYVAVPDILVMIDWILAYGWGVWQERLIFGDQDYPEGGHRAGFDFDYLEKYLELAGFGDIRKVDKFPLNIIGTTANDITYPDRLNENGRSTKLTLFVMARKVSNISEVANG